MAVCDNVSDWVTSLHDMTRSEQNYCLFFSFFHFFLLLVLLSDNDPFAKCLKKLNCRQADALKGCLRYKKQHLLITNLNFHKQI